MDKLIMTPGPTYVRKNVREAMSRPITNPDLDLEFYEDYKGVCDKIQRLLNTKNTTLILDGEGILGLEAACASLIEENDKVLCIDNGIYGYGFGDFAKLYGGKVDYLTFDRREGLNLEKVREYLIDNNDYKVATLVQCETPSGITNDIGEICKLLKEYNILTIVDAVSGIGGEEINVDEWKIDIVLGGSQKCLSGSPGLSFLSLSEDAKEAMKNRETPIKAFYANLSIWENWYENKWFPYTQPISDIYGLDKALDNYFEGKNSIARHRKYGTACRKAIEACGLELFARNSQSNTVTTVMVPEGIEYSDIFNKMLKEQNILIAGGFDFLAGKVFRIGHMGENCYEDRIFITLKALDTVLRELGVRLRGKLHKEFERLL